MNEPIETTPLEETVKQEKPVGFWRQVWRRYRRSKSGLVGLSLALLMLGLGLFAPVLANWQPIICKYKGEIYAPGLVELVHSIPLANRVIEKGGDFGQARFTPGEFRRKFKPAEGDWVVMPPIPFGPKQTTENSYSRPSGRNWLGTDALGRDLASRMVHGARVSMLVGFVSVGIATLIGITLGSIAGYFGGIVDVMLSRLIEVVICFPTFFLILSIVVWLPPSIWAVMIVIGLTSWTGTARFVRGEFIRLRDSEYSLAATALGASHVRIIFKHILPNSLAPVFVTVTFGIASAIITESALSWLGLGVQPPNPSWGSILRDAWDNLKNARYMIFPPCIAIFIGVLTYNLIGDTLRDAVDPRVAKR